MSLAEVVVSMATFSFVMFAILGLVETTARQQPKDQERADALREAQVGLARMTRELRQGYKVLDADSSSMYVRLTSQEVDKHVKYDCGVADPAHPGYTRCVRWEALVGQPLPTDQPGEVVIDRSLSSVLFSYSPGPLNPNYVQVKITVPQKGELKTGYRSNFVLDDGFYLRNTDVLR